MKTLGDKPNTVSLGDFYVVFVNEEVYYDIFVYYCLAHSRGMAMLIKTGKLRWKSI